jgi:hypothetical protein
MNFKTLLTLLLGICLFMNIEAKQVNIAEAEKVAKNFIYITLNKYDKGISYDQLRLKDPYTYQVGGNPVFYAFQLNPGFIIISADDAYIPVIGYSFEGKFTLDNAPASYKGFILNYAEEILYARANQIEPTPEFTSAWAELRNDDYKTLDISRNNRDVAPLLSSTWDQGSPYNIDCPEDPAGPGGHTWVGCVATCMAQIMYYWRYPETGTGQHCYIPGHYSYGQQCADFANTHYNWTGMINSIDNRHPEANAEMQYQCAVSVNMNFDPNGSGAQSSNVPAALNLYLRYNHAEYREKNNYTLPGWIALLKADIDIAHPLYYSGYNSSNEGHAFVCDGYQGDNFHFNFGWSGSGNGYYSLSDVGGFYNGQAVVRNFVPSDPAYPYQNTDTITVTNRSGSITDGSGPAANYLNNNTGYWLISPQTVYDSISSITLTFTAFDVLAGDTVKIYNGASTSDPLLGAYSGTTPPPAMTSANKMLIVFTTDGTGNSKGWYAEYTTTSPNWCQGLVQMTEPSGTFDDGSGNFYYQGGSTCMWKINPPYADKITLSFNYFDTEEGQDKVKVYDGTTQVAEFSGNTIPEPIIATSGSIFMTWSTNLTNNFQGWEAYYEVNNVGINEQAGVKYLEIFPNPATDNIHVSFQVEEKSSLKIKLINLTGQVVFTEEQAVFSGNYQRDISVKALPAGLYFMEITTQSGTTNKKVLVN